MPFGDVSGRVGHILGPSVEFSLNLLFGQPLLGQLYELVLRSCRFAHEALKNQLQHHPHAVRTLPLSTSLPLLAHRGLGLP